MDEKEIVICLTAHFGELIQDACRVQNIQTITDFEALLQREDLKSQIRSPHTERRSQNNTNDRQYNTNYQNKSSNNQYNQRNVDNRAYDSKFHPYNRQSDDRYNERNTQRDSYQNRPNYQNPRQFPNLPPSRPYQQGNRSRNYPSPEQNKVCSTIVERSNGPSTNANSPHLNG